MTKVEEYTLNIIKSDAWVARAIWRLGTAKGAFKAQVNNVYQNILNADPSEMNSARCASDFELFKTVREFYESNGYFTDRHIALVRKKLRPEYIAFLTTL